MRRNGCSVELLSSVVHGNAFSSPKTLLFFAPQVVDSTHPIFESFDAQNHMFVGNYCKRTSTVMLGDG